MRPPQSLKNDAEISWKKTPADIFKQGLFGIACNELASLFGMISTSGKARRV